MEEIYKTILDAIEDKQYDLRESSKDHDPSGEEYRKLEKKKSSGYK